MKDAHLYLLLDKAHTKFKIGLTVDIHDRTETLEREVAQIDLAASYELTDDLLTVTRLEKALHFIFRAWNIRDATKSGGYTEWFEIGCITDVLVEIKRIAEYQGSNRSVKKGIAPRDSGRNNSTQISSLLTRMLFPEYRFRVLKLFYQNPDETHHVREVARLTNTIPGTVNRELKSLSEAGLLSVQRLGNQVEYCANQKSDVYEAMRHLIAKI